MADEKKLALVTGAGSGVGRAVAGMMLAEGYRVVAIGRRLEKLQETAQAYKSLGEILPRAVDVGDRDASSDTVAKLVKEFGPVSVLVNNAGTNIKNRSLDVVSFEDWDRLLRINLTGAFQMIQAVLPGMRQKKDGLIVNVSSVAGIRPFLVSGAAYCASKYGLTGLSGMVSLEEAKNGIRSTVICPGEINTPILDERPVPIPLERRMIMLQPEDVAEAVRFVVKLPPRAHVTEIVIKPITQDFA